MTTPGTRRLLLVTGDEAWGQGWLQRQLDGVGLCDVLWVAGSGPDGVGTTPAGQFARFLGSDYSLLVYNLHQGFHPDAFAAAVGTLRGGGDCVVLAPSLDCWAGFDDPDRSRFAAYPHDTTDMRGDFLARLARLWAEHPAALRIGPGSTATVRIAAAPVPGLQLTDGQRQALDAIERVARGHACRPLVLTADRGRGKSTALGLAAARLLNGGLRRITVIAPHRVAARTLFRHALGGRDDHDDSVGEVPIGDGVLAFCLPMELDTAADSDLVLVDEAAAIPVPLLGALLERHNRLVFASTVHGYEGSGRGFEVRFARLLESVMPQRRLLHLEQPVRWAAGDPLEQLLEQSFLFDAELPSPADSGAVEIRRLDRDVSAFDESLLRSVFGLLVNAHYQTRPSDLRQLLDNPDLHLWVACDRGEVCGVLVGLREGGIDAPMAARILAGERRPRGHLLPQSLAVHAGFDEALSLRTLRIQRIAVHPRRRRQGIARGLLAAAGGWAAEAGFDTLACVYGAELPLLYFWQAGDFRALRCGVRRDPASAAHSLFMLRGLSAAGQRFVRDGQTQFQAGLPWALGGGLRTLDSRLAAHLLRQRDCGDLAWSARERHDLERVASGARQPASADALVWKALVWSAAHATSDVEMLAPLLGWRLQHHSIERVCRHHAIPGRRGLEERLRTVVAALSRHIADGG